MYVLDASEVQKIEARLASAEITHASLTIDLIDHICCMIEERLESGASLEVAEEEVFKELGTVQLKSIEIETQRLTQNKFIMKKRTKIIGLVALGLIVTGFTFKMLHLPGAAMLWGIGILLAAFGFFLMILIDRFSYEKSGAERVKTIIGYVGSAALILGLGFVLLHWPYATFLAEGGGILLLIYFVLSNSSPVNNESN